MVTGIGTPIANKLVPDLSGVFPSVQISAVPNPSLYGQSLTITATVAPSSPIFSTPTGTVTFMDGTTVLGTNSLDATGSASFTTSTLNAGSHAITVNYSGDANDAPTSNTATVIVTPLTPTISVSDPSGTYTGSPFAATALLTGANGIPTTSLEGISPTFTYYVGATTSGANLGSTAPSTVGTYTVVAAFSAPNYASVSAANDFHHFQGNPPRHRYRCGRRVQRPSFPGHGRAHGR